MGNMGMAISEMAEKYERMDHARANECRDSLIRDGKAIEYCTLPKGHKNYHYGVMFRWPNH